MRKILLSVAGLVAGAFISLSAQEAGEVSIGNVQVSQSGTEIAIHYDLSFGERVNWCRVELFLSTDGGRTFKQIRDGLSGDVDKVVSGGFKTILFDASPMKNRLSGKQLAFKVNIGQKDVSKETRAVIAAMPAAPEPIPESKRSVAPKKAETSPAKNRFVVEAAVAVTPQLSYGLMFGMVKNVGWYVKGRSDFSFPASSYECTSDYKTSGGGMWTGGESKKSRLVGTAGVLFKVAGFLYPYAGVGYGSRSVVWKDSEGNWAKVTDYSCSGVSLDAGVMMNFGKFAVSAGVTNTAFKFTEVEIGIGVMF